MLSKKRIWLIVFLIGGYVLCQAIADVSATKLVQLGGLVLPAGTFIFAFTFTIRDLIHKRLGKVWAKSAIVAAGVFNVVQAGYFAGVASLPAPSFYQFGDAWSAIFAWIPSITFASIIAEVVSELIDTEVYQMTKARYGAKKQWLRVLISNIVSLPIDSLIFGALAFIVFPMIFGGDVLTVLQALGLATGQLVLKGVITVISLPTIYIVKEG